MTAARDALALATNIISNNNAFSKASRVMDQDRESIVCVILKVSESVDRHTSMQTYMMMTAVTDVDQSTLLGRV